MEDLNRNKFNPVMRGSATEADTKEIFEALGIKPLYYVGGIADAVSAFKDGRIVDYLKSRAGLQLDASTLEIQTMTKIRLIPMTFADVNAVKDSPELTTIPLHNGAYMAYKELGAENPEKAIPQKPKNEKNVRKPKMAPKALPCGLCI